MRTLFVTSLTSLFLCSSVARADIFTVPLTGVTGDYGPATSKTFSFDLGTSLRSVQSVRIDWAGSTTGGLSYYGTPFSRAFSAYFTPLSPCPPLAFGPEVGQYPATEAFEAVSTFVVSPGYQPDWSSLLDGQVSGTILLEPVYCLPEAQPLDTGSGSLDRASLIIDATRAPEPASAVLLGMSLILGLRHRNRR